MGEAPKLGVEGNEAGYLVPFSPTPNRSQATFTFRGEPNRLGTLNVCPASLRDASKGKIMDDVSFKYLKDFKNFQTILDLIPAVQIREYAFDSRIAQIQNAFAAFSHGFETQQKNAQADFDFTSYVKKLPEELIKSLKNHMKGQAWSQALSLLNNGTRKTFEFEIPFLLYYQICTAKNVGYYTIPYSGKIVDASNGSEGWNTQHGFGGMQTSKESILGTLINFVGKNVKFNTTPMWDGNTTHDFPQIEVQFDLFNDTLDAAINNFLFLTNIMAKNRFLQYHIFQHNPCVYDLKIEGYNRLYMCSGNMHCDYKGVSRMPPEKFFKEMQKYRTGMFKGLTSQKMIDNRMISIPDIYSFKLTFQSLLPNSMNNYLFRFSGNPNVETITDPPSNATSKFGDAVTDANTAAGIPKG